MVDYRRRALDRKLFEALLDAAPLGAAVFDAEGRYLWVNRALAAINQVPASAHLGRTIHDVLPQDVADGCMAVITEVLATGDQRNLEGSFAYPDRPDFVRTFTQSWYPIGSRDAVAALVWEVTDERTVQAGIAATSQRLEVALAGGGLGTWEWNLRTGAVFWDERTAGMFGIPAAEFDGTIEGFNEFVHPDDLEPVGTALATAISEADEFRRDFRIIRRDGEVRWVSSRGKTILGSDGEPSLLVGVIQDRTDTHSQSERLSRTLEIIGEAFFSLDREWRFSYVNAQAERLLQRTRKELLGTTLWASFPAALNSPFETAYRQVMDDRVPVAFEAHYGPLDLWVEVRAHPDTDGIAVYFLDIGERKRAEAEQAALAEEQARAHRAAARLLAIAGDMHTGGSVDDVADSACAVGIEVFDCSRVSLWHIDGQAARLLAQRGGNDLPIGTEHDVEELTGIRQAIAVGGPVFHAVETAEVSEVERSIAQAVGAKAFIYAPVKLGVASGLLLAAINWAHEVEAPDHALLDVAARFAQQTALAVEQARRREAQVEANRLSAQLQANLLPAPVTLPEGVGMGSLYQPGERRLLLGGDFYDVLVGRDGSVSVAIGDVTGHGAEAAAIGAALRAGWRTLALQGAGPAECLQAVDRLLRSERTTDEQLVSLCCAKLELDSGQLAIASAGHPPPILTTAEGTTLTSIGVGLLLGLPVTDPGWDEEKLSLSGEWSLLLYTDGLPEARRSPDGAERIGLEGFAAHVAARAPLEVDDLDRMLRQLQRDVRGRAGMAIEDDVALLVLRKR
jgi:PAS domain S-box-containing protein